MTMEPCFSRPASCPPVRPPLFTVAPRLLLLLAVWPACAATPERLALRHVVLYQNGIGYFERSGHHTRRRLQLQLRSHEIDDVLKTLTVIDRSPGGVKEGTVASLQAEKTGQGAPQQATQQPTTLHIDLGSPRSRDLAVSYAVQTPTWKATYRLVLPDREKDRDPRALLQAWAMINNASGEDWNDVRLTLATGAPLTFSLDLRTPQFVARPNLTGQMVQPAASGAVFAERATAGDSDGDGIRDVDDRCPSSAEDADNFQDTDGCPDPDNDRDRIPDATDSCPTEPETYNGFQDEDGCPDKGLVVVEKSKIEILDKIYFGRNEVDLRPVSEPILDAVAASLRGNPSIRRVDIEGHASADETDPWGLSARRAGAVITCLVQEKVKTSLRARPFGSTRPVDSEQTQAGRERNRRVEFAIRQREDDAGQDDVGSDQASSIGGMKADDLQRAVRPVRPPVDLGGMVRYPIAGTVSIPRGASSMVAFINQRLTGEDIFLYRPDDNVEGSDRYPLRAARLRNATTLMLQGGPVAIFARGTFVGEGLLGHLNPGETAYIPYALDSSSPVEVETSTSGAPHRLVSLVRGTCTVEDWDLLTTRYRIRSGAKVPDRIFIRHPRAQGREPHQLPPYTERGAGTLLIPLPLSASRTTVLEVVERRTQSRTFEIIDAAGRARRLSDYLAQSELADKDEKTVRKLVGMLERVVDMMSEISQLRQRLGDAGVRAGELRQSLRAIEKSAGAAALRARLVARLGQATQEGEALSRKLAERTSALAEARAQLREELREVSIKARPRTSLSR